MKKGRKGRVNIKEHPDGKEENKIKVGLVRRYHRKVLLQMRGTPPAFEAYVQWHTYLG